MASPIQDLLNQILNARYGEQVRGSIHDAIEICYSDVSSSTTTASAAATSANEAASNANNAANNVTTAAAEAISRATEATSAANEAAGSATSAAGQATTAASSATTAAGNASNAADDANAAAAAARTATTSATTATLNANTATSRATTATEAANTAASNANSAATSANEAASDAASSASDCDTARYSATVAATSASNAATRANSAASTIEGLTITSESVGPDEAASATMSTVDNHKNIHFRLKQGATGAPYIIKGNAYVDVAALEAAITSPAMGDQYNVGTEPPYNIYRWTGTQWEDQGKIGISILNLENTEIDNLWNGTPVESNTSKYINHTGLLYLLVNKIKAAITGKVDAIQGKGLSTNDFTNAYIDQINDNSDQVAALSSTKVDKVTGKGLSSNDFTTTYKNLIDNTATLVGTDTLDTTATSLTGAVNELVDRIEEGEAHECLYVTFSYSSSNRSYSDARITSDMYVINCVFENEANITSDTTWTTSNGSIALSGTVSAATVVHLVLTRCRS